MTKKNSLKTALEKRLNGYSAGAAKLRGRMGNWSVYAAAAGSALAITTNASASIIYGTFSGDGPHGGASVQPQPGGTSSIKGIFFPGGEINIKAVSGTSNLSPFGVLSVEGIGALKIFQGSGSNAQNARNFLSGVGISAGAGTLASNARIVAARFSGSDFGSFQSGKYGFVGFADQVSPGVTNYGWLKVDFIKQGDVPHILEVLAWGFETTANQAIAAGATPEPGTMALGILAAGAAGVVALRRRRKQTAE